eukprot:1387177-Prymnesium_polylepis.1
MCREPGLELGGGLFTAHRRMLVYTVRDTHTRATFASLVLVARFPLTHTAPPCLLRVPDVCPVRVPALV